MTGKKKTSLMRHLGAFFGEIVKGAKTSVDDEGNEVRRKEVNRTVEEEERDGVTLRRTTIEEVEIRKQPPPDKLDDDAADQPEAH